MGTGIGMGTCTHRGIRIGIYIENADKDFGTFGVWNALVSSAWQSLKLLITSWGFMAAVLTGLNAFFGVPLWIPAVVSLFITVTIGYAIYSMIFRKDG